MAYFEGFVGAVPTANEEGYRKHAAGAAPLMKELGVGRMVENWGDDVPHGKVTDFYRAVKAKDDETVVFSWFEYPDKATRDATNEKIMSDERMKAFGEEMPFDGKRMILGGFEAIVDERGEGTMGYTDGYVAPVPTENREAYREMAQTMARKFVDLGAVRVVEAWGDDVPTGEVTDYARAVQAEDGEQVIFSFVEWPDKPTRDKAWETIMSDTSMQGQEMPFDTKRMFWGGFRSLLDA
ncbi:DUF1428 domain-containing protein [Pelagerythrobacter sp.]|uniref:DUF1428 domain-containing protein n=1 Tax=Pelagerythrobacter sp. TaxID=2800702 RepID=UPI0035B3A17D